MKSGRKGAIILAGGASSRIGRPKMFLKLGGVTLVERIIGLLQPHFHPVTVVANNGHRFEHLPVTVVQDLLTGEDKNPLRGIHAGLLASQQPYQFVAACDMPFLNLDLINYLGRYAPDYDVVVPKIDSYYQPLHAYYSRSCIQIIEQQVLNQDLKIIDFYGRLNVKTVGPEEIARFDPHYDSFFNINTWDDFRQAREKLARASGNSAGDVKG